MVSILMPSYNASKYIEDSIESIISQTYKDWELIIVDDKSTDDTYIKAQKYASTDTRIRIYQLKENSGSAQRPRQTAFNLSKGLYICSVDADDVIDSTYLDLLIKRQIETEADAVIGRLCNMSAEGVRNNPINPPVCFNLNSILSGKEAFMLTVNKWTINGLGIFSRDVLERAVNNKFLLTDSINADEVYTRAKFLACNKVAFTCADYYYRDNQDSISQKFSLKHFDSMDAVDAVRLMTLDKFGVNSIQYNKAVKYYLNTVIRCLSLYRKQEQNIELAKRDKILTKISDHWNRLSRKEALRARDVNSLLYLFGFRNVDLAFKLRNYVRTKGW